MRPTNTQDDRRIFTYADCLTLAISPLYLVNQVYTEQPIPENTEERIDNLALVFFAGFITIPLFAVTLSFGLLLGLFLTFSRTNVSDYGENRNNDAPIRPLPDSFFSRRDITFKLEKLPNKPGF